MARAKLRVYAGALTYVMYSSWCGLTQSLYFATARTALALGRPLATGSGGGTEAAAAATAAAAADGVGWGSEVLPDSEQGVVSATTAVGGGAVGRAAHGDEKVEVAGDSMSWSKDPSGSAVLTAESGKVAAARPTVIDWTAIARVNGTSSGGGEGLSVVVRSVVAPDEVSEPHS